MFPGKRPKVLREELFIQVILFISVELLVRECFEQKNWPTAWPMMIKQFFFHFIIILSNMRGEDLNLKRMWVFFLIAGKCNATSEDKIASLTIL